MSHFDGNIASFFQTLGSNYIDYRPIEENETRKEVEFYISKLPLELRNRNDKLYLDMCCGYGRHSLIFAQKGWNVTGVDNSKELLNLGFSKKKALKVDVRFIKSDMRYYFTKDQYHLASILANSFGFFSDEENRSVVKNISTLLKPNGWFIIETFNRHYQIKKINDYPISEKNVPSGKVYKFENYTPETLRKKVNVIFYNQYKKYEMNYSIRLYSFEEMVEMAQDAGLILEHAFGNHHGDSFNERMFKSMILFFRKKNEG